MHFNPQIEQMIQEGGRLAAQGQWARALDAFEQVRKADSVYVHNNGDIQLAAAVCLSAIGRHALAEEAFLRAIELRPKQVNIRVELAVLYGRIGEDAKAHAQLVRALEIEPAHNYALRQLASWHMDRGDYASAERILSPMVALIRAGAASDPGPALIYARYALAQGREREAYELLERFSKNASLPPELRRLILRRMGELSDKLGSYDEAFGYFREAQRIGTQPYDPDAHSRRIEALIAAWTPEAARAMQRATRRDRTPRAVFVLGMPRSGTSLAERIIGAHPQACACGEQQGVRRSSVHLDPGAGPGVRALPMDPGRIESARMDEAAEAYLAQMREVSARLGKQSVEVVTDKQPYNFFYVPVIAAMLPGARIVHTIRRPEDACLSTYFQFFGGTHPHSHDLYNLGRFYRDYERLMVHWKLVAPELGVEILDVGYDEIVEDLEGSARRLVAHSGLDWDGACLGFDRVAQAARTASNDQVRRPLYRTSLDRASNYERHLGPLRAGLAGSPRPR